MAAGRHRPLSCIPPPAPPTTTIILPQPKNPTMGSPASPWNLQETGNSLPFKFPHSDLDN